MFLGQDLVRWEDFPLLGMILVPKVIAALVRENECRMVHANPTPKPRMAGPLTHATWQQFTVEKIPYNELVPVDIPSEIALAQLVSAYILPSGFDRLDSNPVFQWTPEVIPDKSKSDKTKLTVIPIPRRIPPGFNLRVMANILHAYDDGRKRATCVFGSAKIRFTLREGDTVGRLAAMAIDWMKQRGQGDQWKIERNLREAIDVELEYPITPIQQVEEVTIYLKQSYMKIRITEPWTALSDRLVQHFGLSRGSMLRIYPVDGDKELVGDDDHAYSFDWKNGAQYWFEIVHDLSRDRHNLTREIRMADHAGRVGSSNDCHEHPVRRNVQRCHFSFPCRRS
jgi:hypothetical protein